MSQATGVVIRRRALLGEFARFASAAAFVAAVVILARVPWRQQEIAEFITAITSFVSLLTIFLVIRQTDLAVKQGEQIQQLIDLMREQGYEIGRLRTNAAEHKALTERQTVIVEDHDRVLHAKPDLKLAFAAPDASGGTACHLVEGWRGGTHQINLPLRIYNSGKLANEAKIEIFLDRASLPKRIGFSYARIFNAWHKGTDQFHEFAGTAVRLESYYSISRQPFAPGDGVDVDRLYIRLQPGDGSIPIYWKIVSGDVIFPGPGELGRLEVRIINLEPGDTE